MPHGSGLMTSEGLNSTSSVVDLDMSQLAAAVEESIQAPGALEEAIAVIDKELSILCSRQMVSAGEVTDLLLDIRSKLIDAK